MLALLFTVAVPNAAASTYKWVAPPPVDPRILVTSVDSGAGTIEIKYMRNKTTQTYKIDDITAVNVNDHPGKIADIEVGMQVRGSVERNAQTLDSISVGTADPAPKGAK